jgi:hypothetical protein
LFERSGARVTHTPLRWPKWVGADSRRAAFLRPMRFVRCICEMRTSQLIGRSCARRAHGDDSEPSSDP